MNQIEVSAQQNTITDNAELMRLIKTFTADQLRFVAVRPFVQSDIEAAERIGRSKHTVAHWPNKQAINEAVRLMSFDGAIVAAEILHRHVPEAALELVDELEHKKVEMRHRAATQILDRAGVPTEANLNVKQDDAGPETLAEALRIVGQGTS